MENKKIKYFISIASIVIAIVAVSISAKYNTHHTPKYQKKQKNSVMTHLKKKDMKPVSGRPPFR